MRLSIGELALAVGGKLRLGSLPPLAGPYEPVRRIVVETRHARPGDVYWALAAPGLDGALLADDAFLRGAFGVVVSGRRVEPWAGRFAIEVADANAALAQLASRRAAKSPRASRENFAAADSTELVRAMLAGYAVTLENILDELSRNAASYVA